MPKPNGLALLTTKIQEFGYSPEEAQGIVNALPDSMSFVKNEDRVFILQNNLSNQNDPRDMIVHFTDPKVAFYHKSTGWSYHH